MPQPARSQPRTFLLGDQHTTHTTKAQVRRDRRKGAMTTTKTNGAPTSVPCARCHGTGRVQMTGLAGAVYAELALMTQAHRRAPHLRPMTIAQLRRHLAGKHTPQDINNALTRLMRNDLVTKTIDAATGRFAYTIATH
jgi:hypothetical protein